MDASCPARRPAKRGGRTPSGAEVVDQFVRARVENHRVDLDAATGVRIGVPDDLEDQGTNGGVVVPPLLPLPPRGARGEPTGETCPWVAPLRPPGRGCAGVLSGA